MRVRPTVLAVPGAVLGPWALKRMTRALESKGEFAVHMVDTRAWSLCLDDAAEVAAEALRMHKQPSTQVPVHIVTHGAGALVVRRAFQLLDWEGQNTRVVMLGPPNKGSRIARRAARSSLWRAAVGHGVVSELGALGSRHFAECGDPPASASVLVIAGVSSGLAPWIPLPAGFTRGVGQHDGAVTVREAGLRTPHSLLRVRASHATLPLSEPVIDATVAFLSAPSASDGLRKAEAAAKAAMRWRWRPPLIPAVEPRGLQASSPPPSPRGASDGRATDAGQLASADESSGGETSLRA
uniref:GPI inositol-deacylase n=1 Tax=Cafeteria roenbergensis TaxID=33653 RepID=A0A7S0PJ21_CAFRO